MSPREVLLGERRCSPRPPRSPRLRPRRRPDDPAQRRCAVVVMTLAPPHQPLHRRGQRGTAAASACSAWRPRPPSSARTIAREAVSFGGSRSRWLARWASTWRSVSTTKPRLRRSPVGPRASRGRTHPRTKRVEQAGRSPSSSQALTRPGQVVGFLRAAASKCAARGVRRRQGLGVVERLRADFPDVVDPHQRA